MAKGIPVPDWAAAARAANEWAGNYFARPEIVLPGLDELNEAVGDALMGTVMRMLVIAYAEGYRQRDWEVRR